MEACCKYSSTSGGSRVENVNLASTMKRLSMGHFSVTLRFIASLEPGVDIAGVLFCPCRGMRGGLHAVCV